MADAEAPGLLGRARASLGDRNPATLFGAAVVLLVVLPLVLNSFWTRIALGALMWIGLAQSWNMIGGYAGYLDFGHGAYFGIGAFTTGIAMTAYNVPFTPALLFAGVVCAVVALGIGIPTLRLKGAYFAIATWAFSEAMQELALIVDITGGTFGMSLPTGAEALLLPLPGQPTPVFFYYVMLTLALVAPAEARPSRGRSRRDAQECRSGLSRRQVHRRSPVQVRSTPPAPRSHRRLSLSRAPVFRAPSEVVQPWAGRRCRQGEESLCFCNINTAHASMHGGRERSDTDVGATRDALPGRVDTCQHGRGNRSVRPYRPAHCAPPRRSGTAVSRGFSGSTSSESVMSRRERHPRQRHHRRNSRRRSPPSRCRGRLPGRVRRYPPPGRTDEASRHRGSRADCCRGPARSRRRSPGESRRRATRWDRGRRSAEAARYTPVPDP